MMNCDISNVKQAQLLELLAAEKKARIKKLAAYDWEKNAREKQKLPEGDWKIWLILAGRGFGKTRTGAESVRKLVEMGHKRVCVLGSTELDAVNIMLQGKSGLLNVYPYREQPKFCAYKRTITWQHGASAIVASGSAYEQLRGPEFDCAWIDELAKFPDPEAAFEQLLLALRLNTPNGMSPRMIITTTPKPLPILKKLIARKDTIVTYGTTFENKNNLSSSYLEAVENTFANTRFGAQELFGQIVEDDDSAFCKPYMIKREKIEHTECSKIVVAVDPAATNTKDETGIMVCGLMPNGTFVILEDASERLSPAKWAEKAVRLYHAFNADRIVAEVNQGGDMVETLIKQVDSSVRYSKVYATKGKMLRAQPIAALYEKGQIKHIADFPKLEEQMLTNKHMHSPDRLDAMVWGITFLLRLTNNHQFLFSV